MDEFKKDILYKIKYIENMIINTKRNNHNNKLFYILNENIDSILENDIKNINNISKTKNKNGFKNLPVEIIENIFDYIDINLLFNIKYLCKKLNHIIDNYLEKHIYYSFVFKINKYNISKSFYQKIICNNCKNILSSSCKKCKIKKCEYKYKNIKNVEIKIVENYSYKDELMVKQSNEFIDIIKEVYNNSNIYNLRLIIDSYNYTTYKNKKDFENIFVYIIRLTFNETKNKVELLSCNEINEEIYIKNSKLKYLNVPNTISNLRLEMKNLLNLEIYKSSKDNNIFNFIDYINNFSLNVKVIKINSDLLKEFKYLEKINSKIKTLSIICNCINENEIIEDLQEILYVNKSIKNIKFDNINEKLIKKLNNNNCIDRIFIDEKYKNKKYINKYKKVYIEKTE